MEIKYLFESIIVITGIAASLLTAVFTFQRIKKTRTENSKQELEYFRKIKNLSSDIEGNYTEALILLRGLTNARLTKEEIKWLIHEPGAFLKIEEFGKIGNRYCEIDIDKGEFTLTRRISNLRKRVVERLKICGFGFAVLIVSSLLVFFTVYLTENLILSYLALGIFAILVTLIFWASNIFLRSIDKAIKLKGKPLKK